MAFMIAVYHHAPIYEGGFKQSHAPILGHLGDSIRVALATATTKNRLLPAAWMLKSRANTNCEFVRGSNACDFWKKGVIASGGLYLAVQKKKLYLYQSIVVKE